MPESTRDVNLETSNLATWSKPEVASYYSSLTYLTPCEQLLFDKYLRPGMAILDMGVGGGRTTPYLSSIAGRYVGADYSAEMIAAMRRGLGRAPGLVPVPAWMLEAGLRAAGRADAYERLAGPLVADPAALLRLGWAPPVTAAAGLERLLHGNS